MAERLRGHQGEEPTWKKCCALTTRLHAHLTLVPYGERGTHGRCVAFSDEGSFDAGAPPGTLSNLLVMKWKTVPSLPIAENLTLATGLTSETWRKTSKTNGLLLEKGTRSRKTKQNTHLR